jgi:hypothetical protein
MAFRVAALSLATGMALSAGLVAQKASTVSQAAPTRTVSVGETRRFVSSKDCGFEFDYPTDWMLVPSDNPATCAVRLRPVDFATKMKGSDADVYTLDINVQSGTFLEMAADIGFDFVKGQWALFGRHHMQSDAEVISTGPWHGLRGYAAAGCYDLDGKYIGLCEQPTIVLRDDDEQIWSMRGGPQSEDVFDQILASFHFRTR